MTNTPNPIKTIRKEYNLTQRALASMAGVTDQVILKVEQGVYPTLPPSVGKAIHALTNDGSASDIEQRYARWIEQELRAVQLPPNTDIQTPADFVRFRHALCHLNGVSSTVNSFCTLMKIHPYVIQKYEAGRLKSIPVQLIERIAYIKGEFNGESPI